ncbi:MAG: heavy metal translocating P-type ATPase [Candidatus Electrothrix aestuarii]|uniref:P-type Zn(2+) transporter n=1 Tax=Candidatus Electrothrix aestuarii TaxID=3062594 RepID=A0AAU8LY44_9BACT|nr:heavy metal translocating P-type ATPase [Candidatus Electrothrix aestuarii]
MLFELSILSSVAYVVKTASRHRKDGVEIVKDSIYGKVKNKLSQFDADPLIDSLLSPEYSEEKKSSSQRQAKGTAEDIEEKSNSHSLAEKDVNRDMVISTAAMGTAIVGRLVAPPMLLLSLPGWAYVSMPAFIQAYDKIRRKEVDISTIYTVTAAGCFFGGYYISGTMAAFFYVLSKKLLIKITDDSKHSLIDVFNQQPRYVYISVGDGLEERRPFDSLRCGDTVVIHAGNPVPADGTVVEGTASVDQHILTGESQPVEKEKGDKVFAATVVLTGKLYINVEKAGQETSAAQIGKILEEVTKTKTEWQIRAEDFTQKTVMPTLAAGALMLPFGGPMAAVALVNSHFGYRLSIVSSISVLTYMHLIARQGVLIKNGQALDQLHKVDTVVFDKTGTLTSSVPHVCTIHSVGGYNDDQVLAYAAAAEGKNTHPIAQAIVAAAEKQKLELPPLDENSDEAYQIGYGIQVKIGGEMILLGSRRFMEKEQIRIESELVEAEDTAYEQGHSLVMLAVGDSVAGALEFAPTLRPQTRQVIRNLQIQQNKNICILSGDHEMPTKSLARKLGIKKYFSDVLPQDKAEVIKKLQAEGRTVCFVGDGINDSIALKQADVSVSLRGASSIAVDTADIILMNEELAQLSYLFTVIGEYENKMRTNTVTLLSPSIAAAAGVLLFHFNVVDTLLLKQVGLTVSLLNTARPLMKKSDSSELFQPSLTEVKV